MVYHGLVCQLKDCLAQEVSKSLHDFVLLLLLLMLPFVDIVFKEEHFDVVGLAQVPLMSLKHSFKLVKRNLTRHAYAMLLHKLLEIALLMFQ